MEHAVHPRHLRHLNLHLPLQVVVTLVVCGIPIEAVRVHKGDAAMKVETDLKAGSFLEDAAQGASKAASQATDFVTEAARQADSLTKTVSRTASSVWDAVSSSLYL